MADSPIVIKNWGPGGRQVSDVAAVPVQPPPSVTTTIGEGVNPLIMQASPTIWTKLEELENRESGSSADTLPWPSEAFSETVTLDGFATQTSSFTVDPLFFRLSSSGNVNGAQKIIRVPAYSAPSVIFHADLNQEGVDYDPNFDLNIVVTYANGRAFTRTSYLTDATDARVPSVVYAHLLNLDEDIIEVKFDEDVEVASIVGLSLIGDVGGVEFQYVMPRTDLRIARFRLTGPLSSTSDVQIVVDAVNGIVDGAGRSLPAQTIGVWWRVLTPDEMSGITIWQTGDTAINSAGQWPTPSTIQTALIQQSFDDSRRPAQTLMGYDGHPTIDFTGVNVTASAATNLFTVTTGALDFVTDMNVSFYPVGAGSSLPTGITANTPYFVRDATSTQFAVSATAGGAAIDLTSDGAGTILCLFQSLLSTVNLIGGGGETQIISRSANDAWIAFVPKAILVDVGVGSEYLNTSPLGGQGGWDIHVDKGAGSDTWTVDALMRPALWVDVQTPCQERQALLARHRHGGGNLSIKRDYNTQVSAACGDLLVASWAFTPGTRQADTGFLWNSIMEIVVCSEVQSPRLEEGLMSYFASRGWGESVLLPNLRLPQIVWAIEGIQTEICWEQTCLSPTPSPTSAELSQYEFEVDGLTTPPTVNSSVMTWTPGALDVGDQTMRVQVSRESKIVATDWATVHTVPSTGSGTMNILIIGDSWTDSDILGVGVYNVLTAMGYTVNMLGTRGGQAFTADNATDTFTANTHQYSDGQVVDVYTLTGTLPAGLTAGTNYYTRDVTANTFKLALSPGGAAINITDDGSGTCYVRAPYERNEGRGGYSWNDFVLGDQPSPFIDEDGRYSLSYYIANSINGVTPTHTLYQLGINGVLNGGISPDDTVAVQALITEAAIAPAEFAINDAISVSSSMAQAVLTPSAPNILQSAFFLTYGTNHWRWGWRRTQNRLARRYMDRFNTPQRRVWGVDAYGVNPGTDFEPIDPVHPTSAGYEKVYRRIAAWAAATQL